MSCGSPCLVDREEHCLLWIARNIVFCGSQGTPFLVDHKNTVFCGSQGTPSLVDRENAVFCGSIVELRCRGCHFEKGYDVIDLLRQNSAGRCRVICMPKLLDVHFEDDQTGPVHAQNSKY